MMGKFKVIGIMDNWKKGDLPGNQMVNIVLSEHFQLDNGFITLTAQLASDNEVDYAVDHLIKELEVVRKKAKDNISKTNKKICESL